MLPVLATKDEKRTWALGHIRKLSGLRGKLQGRGFVVEIGNNYNIWEKTLHSTKKIRKGAGFWCGKGKGEQKEAVRETQSFLSGCVRKFRVGIGKKKNSVKGNGGRTIANRKYAKSSTTRTVWDSWCREGGSGEKKRKGSKPKGWKRTLLSGMLMPKAKRESRLAIRYEGMGVYGDGLLFGLLP